MNKIKTKIKNNKPKGVLLPKASTTGQTNSTNPTSLKQLIEAHHAMQNAREIELPDMPAKPGKRMPVIDSKYERMGKSLGICPYELRDIMTFEFNEQEELAFSLLKKFVAAAKLSGSVDFTESHRELKEAEAAYRANLHRYNRSYEQTQTRIDAIEKKVQSTEHAFAQAWGNILIDLVQKVDRNPNIKSLGEWDRWIVKAIATFGSRYASIDPNSGEIRLSFQECKKMEDKKIIDLPLIARNMQEQELEREFQLWLVDSSIEDLMKTLWTLDRNEDKKREQLEWAITAKSGRIPIRDRWGNIDWTLTFGQTPEQEEFNFEVDVPSNVFGNTDLERKRKLKEGLTRNFKKLVKNKT